MIRRDHEDEFIVEQVLSLPTLSQGPLETQREIEFSFGEGTLGITRRLGNDTKLDVRVMFSKAT
jgi:hypothetical protein